MKLKNLTKGASFALLAGLAIATTSCNKNEAWSEDFGGVPAVEKADNTGWTSISTDKFEYATLNDLYANWELVTQNEDTTSTTIFQKTLEEWSAFCAPHANNHFLEQDELLPLILDGDGLTIAAYAQPLTKTAAIVGDDGEVLVEADPFIFGSGQAVTMSSNNVSASIITAGDQVTGLAGMIKSKVSYAATADKAIRIKVTAKMNAGKNIYPMIWLLPTDETSSNVTEKVGTDRYAVAKERNKNSIIKVMEHHGENNEIIQYLNSNYISNWGQTSPVSLATTTVDYADVNEYMVEISNDAVIFYINDVKTLTYPRFDAANQEPNDDRYPYIRDYNLIIGIGMGEVPAEGAQTFDLDAPVELDVLSVEYFEK